MIARKGSAGCLVALLLVSPVQGCADEEPGRGVPSEEDSDGKGEEAVCIEQCDPVEADCAAGQACLPANPGFSCQPVPSGGELGLHEACGAGFQACGPGLVCLQAAVPGCTGGTACCVSFCDTMRSECTDGTQCYPYFEAASACHEAYEEVGVCVLY